MTNSDIAKLLNAPREAGVRLTMNLVTNTVEITTKHYHVATVTLRTVEPLMSGGTVAPEDVLHVRMGAEELH